MAILGDRNVFKDFTFLRWDWINMQWTRKQRFTGDIQYLAMLHFVFLTNTIVLFSNLGAVMIFFLQLNS